MTHADKALALTEEALGHPLTSVYRTNLLLEANVHASLAARPAKAPPKPRQQQQKKT